MKYTSSAHKTTRATAQVPEQGASAGPNSIAIVPPSYGIDVVDQQPVQAALAHELAYQSLESATWPARDGAIQRRMEPPGGDSSASKAPQANSTGLPGYLKAGIERLSGLSLDDVRVHYNSAKPAQLHALAYTQGTQIHVGPGQERHLPHEAWHVVQQKQGRVEPTMQAKGVAINDDQMLEREAFTMGQKAIQRKCAECEKKAEREDDLLQTKSRGLQTTQFAKGDSCYCPGWTKSSPYHNLPEYRDQVGPGEAFTATQMNDIYAANAAGSHAAALQANVTSYYESDSNQGELVKFSDINHLIAEVDHIVPQTKWGCNSVKNAQVISSWENSPANKGENYPYGGYTGYSVFDPTANIWHKNKADAILAGAKKAANLP